ncbi:C39 family peptidase [Candidatus Dependentiae bacterium]|nr:C39 family peptidase [Candidatus Dependentiae bacterium]
MMQQLRVMLLLATCWGATSGQWTAVYKSIVRDKELVDHRKTGAVILSSKTIPCNQMIVSCNAQRPAFGKFIFYIRVRTAATKKWSSFYKMFSWGAQGQLCHRYEPDKSPHWCYVRLQMPKGQLADSVEVTVYALHGARLHNVHAVFVAATKEDEFVPQEFDATIAKLAPVAIKGLPLYSQMVLPSEDANRICSPTSLSMVTAWVRGDNDEDVLAFAQKVYDPSMDAYGNWPLNVLHAYNRMIGKAYIYACRLNSFAELHSYLQRKLPVVVSIRGKIATMPSYLTFGQGHIVVVVGWDPAKQLVMVHDPSFKPEDGVLHGYPIRDFLAAWNRSRNFSYILEPIPVEQSN